MPQLGVGSDTHSLSSHNVYDILFNGVIVALYLSLHL